jgi:hypothetical protein
LTHSCLRIARIVSPGDIFEAEIVFESEWSIDSPSGHCAHPDGLEAYFDSRLTATGALRCVGPFGPDLPNLSAEGVLTRLFELVSALEDSPEFGGAYVVWGAYVPRPTHREMELKISGQRCGWIPNLAIRSEAIFAERLEADAAAELFRREWSFLGHERCVSHRSGLSFRFDESEMWGFRTRLELQAKCEEASVDKNLVQRGMLKLTAKMLAQNAFNIFRANSDIPLDSVFRFGESASVLDDEHENIFLL